MIETIPATHDHLNEVIESLHIEEPGVKAAFETITAEALAENARTLMSNGVPLAVFGLQEIWPGVAEAWVMISRYGVEERPVLICRVAKRLMDEHSQRFWRIQASVNREILAANDFADFLGFESEGIMRKYGQNQEDFIRYARVN